jgi:hypothetical protein
MKRSQLALIVPLAGLLIAGLSIVGCSKKVTGMFVKNKPPTVRLTSAPYDTTNRYFYAYKLNWIGDDPDGRVVKFVYAVDPPLDGRPINWTSTTKNEQIIFFKATQPDPTAPDSRADDFHVFAIRAIDDGGDSSQVVTRAFFSYTVAPSVHLTDPTANHLNIAFVTPSVTISWAGSDPDGQFTQKPIKYKYKLFSASGEFTIATALAQGGLDSLRRFYAPRFAGWDSTSAETTQVQYTNLTPDADYLFVVVAFDEAGAYSPIFSLDANVLRMRVLLANAGGPHITMFNEYFTFEYVSGSYSTDPSKWVPIDVPAEQPITFNWSATTDHGAILTYFRWRLGGDVSDETPRTNEITDIGHWSAPNLNATSATVGPFPRDTVLFFYIEAADNNGLKSLGIIRFHVVKPTFARDLGIVDDTRYLLDVYRAGTSIYQPPSGNWPTAAELDTFMYARGGNPYRAYPTIISRRGIFTGYDFDTVNTRIGRNDLTVPLALLGEFRHLIWLNDNLAAGKTVNGVNVANGISALRYMNNRNRVNTLATYVKQGGQVWLMGSGIAHSAQIEFDKVDGGTYSLNADELHPGRFMYDIVHWRDDIKEGYGNSFAFHKAPRAVGGWAGAPNYHMMPDTLRPKALALGDTMPPNHVGAFYTNLFPFTYLDLDNFIVENLNPDPAATPFFASTLDTLYNVVFPPTGLGPQVERPVATYYHGLENARIVYTAFDPWLFSVSDFLPLVDFVLQDIWGIQRSGAPGRPLASRPVPTRPNTVVHPTQGGARALMGGAARRASGLLTAPPGQKPRE